MAKTITICFRTSERLRNALEKVATEERRTLSSTIENILYIHIEEREEFKPAQEENRRYPRKSVSVPALLSIDNETSAGIVLNVSLGGLQISIPSGYQFEVKEDTENSKIAIVFALPEIKKPLSVQCMPKHIVRSNGDTIIGASFEDTDFTNYQTLQDYLIN
ncbi:MAG: hypothetical protein C0392_04615 [Syntrophus sp. (in: bacteria)]|nr:hypothetical protein [Syntrophus sp. (in: bacteria)]